MKGIVAALALALCASAARADYVCSNDGLSCRWQPSGYQPQAGEIDLGAAAPTPAQLTAAFAGYAAAVAAQAAANAAQAALASGVQVSSTSFASALNGTYAIDPATQGKVQAVALYIAVNGRFPAGQSTLAWPDIAGVAHSFPTTAEFQAFATALGDYVTALSLGQSPSQPIAIP